MFGTTDKSPWGNEFIEYEIAREVFRNHEGRDEDYDDDEDLEDEEMEDE